MILSVLFIAGHLLSVPNLADDGSSLSELSGISAASNKTYITEESSLVLETVEDGMTK